MRWRNVLLTACSALLLAGCGGEDPQVADRRVTGPTIERAVADQLATRSDTIANLPDGGDACGARKEAARLRDELTGAINDGAIPELYRGSLRPRERDRGGTPRLRPAAADGDRDGY
jgi:hypothetical protein